MRIRVRTDADQHSPILHPKRSGSWRKRGTGGWIISSENKIQGRSREADRRHSNSNVDLAKRWCEIALSIGSCVSNSDVYRNKVSDGVSVYEISADAAFGSSHEQMHAHYQ